MKHIERQKRGASSSDDDEGSEDEDKDLAVLKDALDVLRRPSDSAGPSGTDCSVNVADEGGAAQMRATSSPLRGPSPKCP